MKKTGLLVVMGLALALAVPNARAADRGTVRLEKQVKHELNMLPYVNAFDYLAFTVDNGTVTLTGEVTNPVSKSDAGNVVKRIEGVERVDNQIKVLPVSFYDSRLRLQLYRTIYGYPTLQRYSMGVNAPIRILVENGHVKLVGYVDSEGDKIVAGIRANSVPGIFSVDNQLKVDRS